MTRDLRDPERLGLRYLEFRKAGMWIEHAVWAPVENYSNGRYISCDPKDHHSKVDQTLGNLDDGGSS